MDLAAKIFFTAFLSSLLLQDFSQAADEDDSNRIIGGNNATSGQFRYQAALFVSGSFICGGSIIQPFYILTAAHCLDGSNITTVRVGSIYLQSGGVVYNVVKQTMHPQYDTNTFANDIGLIKTARRIMYTLNVRPISLPTFNIVGGRTVVLTGWGGTSFPNGSIANQLQYLITTTINNDICAWAYDDMVTNTTLCTYHSNGKGSCYGDSGGPLVSQNQVHAVMSFSLDCASGYPDAYTRVFPYKSWILNITANSF